MITSVARTMMCWFARFWVLWGVTTGTFAAELQDPTKPAYYNNSGAFAVKGPEDLRLDAIFYTEKGRSAVINGVQLTEGDQFEGLTVLNITKEFVTVKSEDGKLQQLSLIMSVLR